MQEEIEFQIEESKENMEGALEHLQKELVKIRTGKASSSIFNGLMVDYYGSPTPLKQVANISNVDARTLVIQPWEKGMLENIERAIFQANMGITPQNDGEIIRITIPMLTEERRRDLVKQVKLSGEDAKVSVRNARRAAMEFVKKSVKDGFSEDAGKDFEDSIQKMTNSYGAKIDGIVDAKEKDIMTI